MAERRRFAVAARHSRRVARLRRFLPLAAAAMALVMAGYAFLVAAPEEPQLALATNVENGKVVMSNPVLAGQTDRDLPYELNALRALQAPQNLSQMDLEGLSGTVPISADKSIYFQTTSGEFDSIAQRLVLDAPFLVETSDGEKLRLRDGVLDIAGGSFSSDSPVRIETDRARLDAQRIDVYRQGQVARFEGGVRLVVTPDNFRSEAGGDAAPRETSAPSTDAQ